MNANPARRAPLPCPACGGPMNRHAEKLALPSTSEELGAIDVVLFGVLEEHHLCPACGRIECLRLAG